MHCSGSQEGSLTSSCALFNTCPVAPYGKIKGGDVISPPCLSCVEGQYHVWINDDVAQSCFITVSLEDSSFRKI